MTSARTVRVLAADDSAVMRGVLRMVFQLQEERRAAYDLPRMHLCGVVRDGVEALEAVRTLEPDVLLLDLEMPRLDGLGVLAELRRAGLRVPVILCSAHTERGARKTLDALALGAKDYVMKPAGQSDLAAILETLLDNLLPRIAALTSGRGSATATFPVHPQPASGPPRVVVVGLSTGGPAALETMLPALPGDLPVPMLIVQHMPKLFTGALARRLDTLCALTVLEAWDGAEVRPGTVWIAPGDRHMELRASLPGEDGALRVRLHDGPALHGCKPAADYLFHSAASLFGRETLGLVMTGMGCDGLAGTKSITASGGAVLAQDQATSAIWGMPGCVVQAGLAATLPLHALASGVCARLGVSAVRPPGPLRPLSAAVTEVHHGLF